MAKAQKAKIHKSPGSQGPDELVTSVVDYNLGSIFHLLSENTINVSPGYQRRFRWDEKQQSLLIESFLLNIPVPPIYLSETDEGQYYVIDGQQRLTAIKRFFSGDLKLEELEIRAECNGLRFAELANADARKLQNRSSVRAIIILQQSHDEIRLKVFQRLNSGTEKLNSQEIRNSTFPGTLNERLLQLSVHPQFSHMIGTDKDRDNKTAYKNMRDVEFVLRFFTFCDRWEGFSNLMSANMDRFMSENRNADAATLDNLEKRFLKATEIADAAFGEYAFRRWWPNKNRWDRAVMSALYDAVILACQSFEPKTVRAHREAILVGYQSLFERSDFLQSIEKATHWPPSVCYRVRAVKGVIAEALR